MNTKSSEHDDRIAVRAYAVPQDQKKPRRRPRKRRTRPSLTLIFDCSTSHDISRKLTYGSYLVLKGRRVVDKGFFYGDDATQDLVDELNQSCRISNRGIPDRKDHYRVLSREQFIRKVFLKVGYHARGIIAGVNLPFQISRIAIDWGEARADFYKDGFSFTLLNYEDEEGKIKPHPFVPRVAVKAIDGRRALIGFTSAYKQDEEFGKDIKEKGRPFRGHFVDCRVLAYALSGKYFDLNGVCGYFGIKVSSHTLSNAHSAKKSKFHELESRVNLIGKLYRKLVEDFSIHPISLSPSQAYSAASIGKGYLRDIWIKPPDLTVANEIDMTPGEVLGACMVSYYGGRAECRIRRLILPVTYLDFVSMYPTVHVLMDLWKFLIAETIEVKDCTQEITALLERITPEELFSQSAWKSLPVLVQVLPEDDVLPVRTKYSKHPHVAYTLAVNEIKSPISLWYTLPDCLASKVLTGRAPKVVRVIRFLPVGVQKNLKSVNVLGRYELDPYKNDFFKVLVELRHKLDLDDEIPPKLKKRMKACLKSIVNATAYGIFIELLRQKGNPTTVDVYGLESFSCEVESPEAPGEFFFPIIGTLLTGGARLMLALLEYEITQRGGTCVFMDTDSAAIVSTRDGSLLGCPGGSDRLPDGATAITAITWRELDKVINQFDQLNPYDRDFVSTSFLKLEDENFLIQDDEAERVELKCLSIASKRYVLFNENKDGIHIHKASEHALGNYQTPVNRDTGQVAHDWIDQAWRRVIRNTENEQSDDVDWLDEFVLTRVQLTTPGMMEWVGLLNEKIEKNFYDENPPYLAKIKPFSSIDHIPVSAISVRNIKEGKQVCLVTPTTNIHPTQQSWINIYGEEDEFYRVISPDRRHWDGYSYPGMTYRELITKHALRPESKFITTDGTPCQIRSRGVLGRRRVTVGDVIHIGKEANDIEKVQAGLVVSEDEVLLTYERDPWDYIQPILAEIPLSTIKDRTGYSRSMVYALQSGDRRPSRYRLDLLLGLVTDHVRHKMNLNQIEVVIDDDKK